ncbi:DUF5107 domain-containing protein [Pontimicrobium sp. SW4]|uniref:DUF5107 domain-containing protein n=1 Tax=Pontimicrobium sp. SW4 TaxID=3153519 RepID=A0AAU7BNP7_9FLAO
MKLKTCIQILCFCTFFLISCKKNNSPESIGIASIKEVLMNFKTYPFSDPSPVVDMNNIYPYFKFDGYTNNVIDQSWKMVVMENDYIKVFVCPEIGGKVWGAIEKSTGKEFLYYNDVVKFRNIAMRGPWTSGGLEFNFGDIGHAPSCSTPVDYKLIENSDGSVSCIVGAYDLPSRTRWNIDIKLPKNKAYLETKVSWFNTTNQFTSYYQWMNAAAKASGNLEFVYPGKNFIGHNGETGNWPIDNNRDISKYENNNFGGYKSYHVLNSYSNIFGGYWKDDDFGFGHYVDYDEKPGKKLWIWGLSDQGMIWEDLLTDTKGQYIEYQSGKLFNQASPGSTFSPFKHKEFQPYNSDVMTELWFPLKNTNGMVAASKYAVLNVESTTDSLTIYVSALEHLSETLEITQNRETTKFEINLKPLEVFKTKITINQKDDFNIQLGDNLLQYSSKQEDYLVNRPINHKTDFNWGSAYGIYTKALGLEKQRQYEEAAKEYHNCIEKDEGFIPAYSRLSLAYYRQMDYKNALKYSKEALSIDTYHPESNYAYGLVNKKLGNITDAKSGFSIASQSASLRSSSFVELAILFLKEYNYTKAIHYTSKAIDADTNNIIAHMIQAFASRQSKDEDSSITAINNIYKLDPLSDFARFEEALMNLNDLATFNTRITNELPFESYLELAAIYLQFNDTQAAISVLKESPQHPIVNLWLANLDKNNESNYLKSVFEASAEMVFPHRVETSEFLETTLKTNSHWKLKYYLGLIYWHKGLREKASTLFEQCQNEPDFAAFYLTKLKLVETTSLKERELLERALELNPNDWRTALALSNNHLINNETSKAIEIGEKFIKLFPENSHIGMNYTSALLQDKQYLNALKFLENFNILPFEGSTEGKKIYSLVCIKLALQAYNQKEYDKTIDYAEKAKFWPRNLGVGKPYDVDEQLENYIIAKANNKLGDTANTQKLKVDLLKNIKSNSETLNIDLALETIKTLN